MKRDAATAELSREELEAEVALRRRPRTPSPEPSPEIPVPTPPPSKPDAPASEPWTSDAVLDAAWTAEFKRAERVALREKENERARHLRDWARLAVRRDEQRSWGKVLSDSTERIEPAGNYALKLCFDDGHDSGLFTWDYLHELATRQSELWADYLAQLSAAGKSRDPNESVVRLML